ncbi:MAG TPA: carboxypeptidase-like regulatory domain-containing protein [Polyangia bacterium]|jgi:hypothetical protein
MRAAAIAAVALTLAGCGASASVNPWGEHDAGVQCTASLTVSTRSPAPGDTIAAEVHPGPSGGPFTYDWSVTDATGAAVVVTPRTADESQVDVPIARAGSYHISVRVTGGYFQTCTAEDSLLARNPTGQPEQVVLRFVPPPASGLQIQQQVIAITGGTPQGDLNVTLDEGIPLDLALADAAGTATADAFVRLIAHDRGFEAQAYVRAGEPLHVVLLDDAYDVLVIPDEPGAPRFAPSLAEDRALASLAGAARLVLDPGVAVQGAVVAQDGAPLAGARVVLTSGRLPSTLGTAAGDGAFTVRVQPGAFGLSVAAPAASGLPDLELDTGITVTAATPDLAIAYDPALAPGGDLDVTVRSYDGSAPVAGARVTLRAQVAQAGTLTSGGLSQPLPGVVRRSAVTDGAGRIVVPALPAGSYDLVVEPLGHGLSEDAVTRVAVTLPAAPLPVQLYRKVRLSGTLARAAGVAGSVGGTRVTAILRGGHGAAALGAAPQASADDGGAFHVRIDPANPAAPLDYLLVADPPPASGLARAMQIVQVGSLGDIDVTTLHLPRGLLLAGTVRPRNGTALAGVYVEASRLRTPAQADPAARAEAVTDASGRFQILFCDPDDME